MPGTGFEFETKGFRDSPDIIAQNVNGIPGHALATWLAGELRQRGCEVSDVFPEDHGWDFTATHAAERFVCACSVEIADAGPDTAHVVLGKNRSFADMIFGRNRFNASEHIVAAVRAALAGNPQIQRIRQD